MLVWRQFRVLVLKNFYVFRAHWLLNCLRCLIFPIAFGLFLAFAQNFFASPTNYGLGSPIPLISLESQFDGSSPLVWVDSTDGNGFVKPQDIMKQITSNFTTRQLQAVRQVSSLDDLTQQCVTNYGGASNCFLTVSFDTIPASTQNQGNVDYTIRGDNSAFRIDVVKHNSGYETKILPLQWAIDKAIIQLSTGAVLPTPQEQPFTWESNIESVDSRRLFYLSLMGSFGGIAFFIAFIGITYQLAGSLALERSSLITSHMQAMGALDSARVLSWHLSTSLLYTPTWLILAGLWKATLFQSTSAGIVILVHLVTGLSLASWTLFFSVPFSKSPQMAAAVTTLVALILSVVPLVLFIDLGPIIPAVLSFVFPPMFFVFALKNIAGFETNLSNTSFTSLDPTYSTQLSGMLIAAVISIFFWPVVAVIFERMMYGVWNPTNSSFWKRKHVTPAQPLPSGTSISIKNLRKVFNTSRVFRRSTRVEAIENLTIDVPTYGIYTLLGPNGAGKSTTLAIIAGLTQATEGSVTFEGGVSRPPHGTLGVVPQKNVLFEELTCVQNLIIWNTIKSPDGTYSAHELTQLLVDCDLQDKAHSKAGTLSGGQKRKLQLAIGLVGGSKIILVDECTSGVDPLSRRSLWRTLSTYRNERTIILTTHFLDEADFLADKIAVLAAPGRLIASDSPVDLKLAKGSGYSVHVTMAQGSPQNSSALLRDIQRIVPTAVYSTDAGRAIYSLHTKETSQVAQVLDFVESSKSQLGITSYDVVGTSIEDIFLDLLDKEDEVAADPDAIHATNTPLSQLQLSTGRACSPWSHAMTIFYKRVLVLRRSWLGVLLALAVGISGAWWPVRYVTGPINQCGRIDLGGGFVSSTWPPYYSNDSILVSPPSLISVLNSTFPEISRPLTFDGVDVPTIPYIPATDQVTFNRLVEENRNNFSFAGGLSLDLDKNEFFVAWSLQQSRLDLFSLTSNLVFSRKVNPSNQTSVARIVPAVTMLPTLPSDSLLTLQWLAVFGAAMSVYPAFFTLYVARERHASVQAMQLSNGLTNPLGLWLGHFLFDSMFSVIIATVIAIVYGAIRPGRIIGIGILWLVMCLYGFAGTLLAYVAAVVVKSPIGAFSTVVITQFIIYLLYLVGYIVTLFTAAPGSITRTMNIIGFTMGFVAPINNVVRAALVSINQFNLLCEGDRQATGPELVSITRYGGPILYLIIWIFALLFILAQVDTGLMLSLKPLYRRRLAHSDVSEKSSRPSDVALEADHAESDTIDPLRVMGVSKSYGSDLVVDNVSFTIPNNALFVMLGPNGAGKTTTFDMIRGHLNPDVGDVKVNNLSTVYNRKNARASLGVCPQFTAMDSHLTVQQHIAIYGRLKGLTGTELSDNVQNLMKATGLDIFANRLATKLSGGNQRKLALAIAFIGNPSVVLIDEYSTGIDAKMKRELWAMLKHVAKDKSVFLTTHSMEEASYLATKVGIMSKRMLAVGTPEDLESRNASYEVHFSTHSKQGLVAVQKLMAKIPGSRMVDDVATRFQVPIVVDGGMDDDGTSLTVAGLFGILAGEKELQSESVAFTVGKSTLETAFIKIINDAAGAEVRMQPEDVKEKKLFGLC